MVAQLRIREAREEDRPALADIFLACRRAGVRWTGIRRPALDDFDRLTEGERLFLAEAVEPLGFVAVWEPERFIHHLFVDPRHQGKGVGRHLVESLHAWLPTPWRLRCAGNNHRALRFYRATGWVEVARGRDGTGEFVEFLREGRLRALP